MAVVVPALLSAVAYSGMDRCVTWEGHEVTDESAFREFLRGPVAARLRDSAAGFEDEMRSLAQTQMATEFLTDFLAASPPPEGWEIGEALAEAVLLADQDRNVVLPWNMRRDKRAPRASLPGADIVGFVSINGEFVLLLGEVKSSSEARVPPSVMTGRGGMAWQLETNATNLEVQRTLLEWLMIRCRTSETREPFRTAVKRLLDSNGTDLLLVGALLRDTQADEGDVVGRATHLASRLASPTRVELLALYLPLAIADWATAAAGST